MQAPTIGRKVWYWAAANELDFMNCKDKAQAFDATVVFVHPSGEVNLVVFDHHGNKDTVEGVVLEDPDGDVHGAEGIEEGYATWMPYQKAKHDEEVAKQG